LQIIFKFPHFYSVDFKDGVHCVTPWERLGAVVESSALSGCPALLAPGLEGATLQAAINAFNGFVSSTVTNWE
jgi:hypothetical protein